MVDDETRLAYARRTPFPEVWRGLPRHERAPALAYWIDKAARDSWAFQGLRELGAELISNGMSPEPPLDGFLAEVLRGERTEPTRWRTNVKRDMGIAVLEHIATTELGITQREAHRRLAEVFDMKPAGVASACDRAGKDWSD